MEALLIADDLESYILFALVIEALEHLAEGALPETR